jgi:hypothetical protein
VEKTFSLNKFIDNDRRLAIVDGIRERIQMAGRHISLNKRLKDPGHERDY